LRYFLETKLAFWDATRSSDFKKRRTKYVESEMVDKDIIEELEKVTLTAVVRTHFFS